MNPLARALKRDGYERTERESPFHEDGTLWTNSYELVCDKTAGVIRKDSSRESDEGNERVVERHEYYNSKQTRMMGGYVSAYDWGHDEGQFTY